MDSSSSPPFPAPPASPSCRLGWGGSPFRPEATSYGAVFMAEEVLASRGDSIQGKRSLVLGAGNVAGHCASKLVEEGAVVLSMSDSRGAIHARDGLTKEHIAEVRAAPSTCVLLPYPAADVNDWLHGEQQELPLLPLPPHLHTNPR